MFYYFISMYHSMHVSTTAENQEGTNDGYMYHFWLIGSSLVKDMKSKLIYRYKKARITTLWDKTIHGAKDFIESGYGKAKVIAYQVGSNDLDDSNPEKVTEDMRQLIYTTQRKVPGSEIVVNELLPRYYKRIQDRREYEHKRIKCNQLLSELCDDLGVHFVRHDDISQIHFSDGIHLTTDGGISQYVMNLKQIVNPLIDVKNDQNPEKQFNRNRHNSNARSNPNTYNGPHDRDGRGRQDYDRNGYKQQFDNNRQNPNDNRDPNNNLGIESSINMKLLRLALQGFPF